MQKEVVQTVALKQNQLEELIAKNKEEEKLKGDDNQKRRKQF